MNTTYITKRLRLAFWVTVAVLNGLIVALTSLVYLNKIRF